VAESAACIFGSDMKFSGHIFLLTKLESVPH